MPSHKNREIKYQGILSDIHGYTSSCENNGTCNDGVNYHTCSWVPGLEGKTAPSVSSLTTN